MTRVHVICEGQTEETFVKELLVPHFERSGVYVYPALLGKPGHKGGWVTFERLFIDIRNRLLGDPNAYCTTFFDFYGLPPDFPGRTEATTKATVHDKARSINAALSQALAARLGSTAMQRLVPYVQMYEYEGLLFSDPAQFANGIGQPTLAAEFQRIRDGFPTPEDINDSPDTAPSKRVIALVPGYEKPLYGTLAALAIGLDAIRRECTLFDDWLARIELLAYMPLR